jgi:hypothetical protein
MDPVSVGIVAAALLAKAVEKAAEKAVEKVGEGAGEAGVGALGRFAGWLRQRLAGQAEAGAAVARVEEAPDSPSRVTALGEVLDRLAQQDPGFAGELRQQVEQARGAGVDVKGITQTAVGNQNVQLADVQGTVHVSYGSPAPGPTGQAGQAGPADQGSGSER